MPGPWQGGPALSRWNMSISKGCITCTSKQGPKVTEVFGPVTKILVHVSSKSAQICFGYKLLCWSSALRHNPADYLHSVQTHQAHGCTCGITDLHTHKNLYTQRVTKIQSISLYCIPSSGGRQLLIKYFLLLLLGWLLFSPF